jgi:transposase InsO family protein
MEILSYDEPVNLTNREADVAIRVGNPYDNAKAESFMKTLKQEKVNARRYRNLNQAQGAIGAFIETVYNRQRLHSALAYRSPDEYEATLARFPGVNVTA